MHNILISNVGFGTSSPQALKTLKKHAHVIENVAGKRFREIDFMEKLPNTTVLIAGTEQISSVALKNAPNLKLIARVGSGVDNIDLKTAEEQKISITYTPTAPSLSVPEFTIGLILNLLKGIHLSDRKMHEKKWFRPMGQMLSSIVCGILGAGKVGNEVIKLIHAISPRTTILFYDPCVQEISNATKVELFDLAKKSDIISLHLPLNNNTHGFINEPFLQNMKKGSYLINTSRGAIVDEFALYQSLKSGHLDGAAFDVFDTEPYDGPLTFLENCLLTSHIGSMVKEVRSLMEEQVVEDVVRFFEKKSPLRPLDGFDFRSKQ